MGGVACCRGNTRGHELSCLEEFLWDGPVTVAGRRSNGGVLSVNMSYFIKSVTERVFDEYIPREVIGFVLNGVY